MTRLDGSNRSQPVVVNIASMAGLYPMPELPSYSVSKAGVVMLTKSVGKFIKQTNVRVVGLCPAFADTQMGQSAAEQMRDAVNHLGGLITPEFVADGLVKVLTEDGNSGQVLILSKRGMAYHGQKPRAKM